MPRYFFDIHDGTLSRDDTGIECVDLDAVRREAKRTLPAMARDILSVNGDQHMITVIVRDENNVTVYTANLTFSGVLLAGS